MLTVSAGVVCGCVLWMRLVDGGQILEPLHPLQLKAPLVLVELGPRHAALTAGGTHVGERLSQLPHAQPLTGDLLLGVHGHRFCCSFLLVGLFLSYQELSPPVMEEAS